MMAGLDEEDLKQQEYHSNRVAYFDSWVKAWIQNRMELDKQLLSLSALAIGLLIGVLSQPDTVLQFCIWLAAGFSFLTCGGLILIIFHQNTKYIEILLDDYQTEKEAKEKVVLGEREKQKTQQLELMTKIAFSLFLIGATLTLLLAINQSGFIIIKGT